MNDKIRINLHIQGKNYPMIIDPKDEAIYREAGRQVEELMNKYRLRYNGSGMKTTKLEDVDYLTMVAVSFAFENVKMENRNDTKPFLDAIQELTLELEDSFKKDTEE
jgi:cell division protein ZapA